MPVLRLGDGDIGIDGRIEDTVVPVKTNSVRTTASLVLMRVPRKYSCTLSTTSRESPFITRAILNREVTSVAAKLVL